MRNVKLLAIVGARPQFIKHFPLELACKGRLSLTTIHTGQHYDQNMSDVFFDQLGMSRPDYMLDVGSGSHGAQTGKMMMAIEEIVIQDKPDYILVYGDTNSTIAGSLVAAKLHIPIVHVEAGLRSYNKSMPEEVNRVLTDHISDYLFVPSEVAVNNLAKEGIQENVVVVGDIMKDLMHYCLEKGLEIAPDLNQEYYYATLHRPYNTDEEERLSYILDHLNALKHTVIFSIHPRTRNAMRRFGMEVSSYSNIVFIDPQGYLNNLGYLKGAQALITDSGGMQKEAYWTQTKCVTIRTETEWVETLEDHANELVFEDLTSLQQKIDNRPKAWDVELYGDATAAVHMIDEILK